jgi:plastocyanin
MKLRITLCVLALTVPLGVALPGRAATVNMSVSNFRFCPGDGQCLPTDFVYVRNPTGNGLIHKNALAGTLVLRQEVHPGDTVLWTYRDGLCDALDGCPGHAVCIENFTVEGNCGNRIMNARSGAVTVSFTVPPGAKRGKLIRYFCNINYHWAFGMTGALYVT